MKVIVYNTNEAGGIVSRLNQRVERHYFAEAFLMASMTDSSAFAI